MTRAGLVAAAILLAAAVPSWAQSVRIIRGTGSGQTVVERPFNLNDAHLILEGLSDELDAEPAASQRPITPLTPPQSAQLRNARNLRVSGQFDGALKALEPLRTALPHHPIVITEMARVLLAKKDFAGVERLVRPERQAAHDSVMTAHELAIALQGLGRRREAAEVTIDCAIAAPGQGAWIGPQLEKIAAADPKSVREALRRALEKRPDRTDLALASSRIEWILGDDKAALRSLVAADRPGPDGSTPVRWTFAQQALRAGTPRDSTGAANALVSLAGDPRFASGLRLNAAQLAWEIERARDAGKEGAPLLARALKDLPVTTWNPDFVVSLSRGLRDAGLGPDARAMLQALGGHSGGSPALELEQALGELRDGPPERALPRLLAASATSEEGAFRYGEALFYTGASDSALRVYQGIAANPSSAFAGAALERIYLLEDTEPRAALPVFGRIAYEEWRGQTGRAQTLTDSLYHGLARGPLWAQAALQLAGYRERAGDVKGALAPLLAVADSLPEDRQAPLARQRAGDLYRLKLKDDRLALAQYEECLARYPRAWNAAEVRRVVEQLRRERRF